MCCDLKRQANKDGGRNDAGGMAFPATEQDGRGIAAVRRRQRNAWQQHGDDGNMGRHWR